MKGLSKLLSILLCIILIIASLPISVIAAENKSVKEKDTGVVSVSEIEEERDIYSKTYETSNGTNVVITSAAPLHYEKDGELVEIDNTLVKSEDASTFTNTSNVYDVELPVKMTKDSVVSLNYEGNEISFQFVNSEVSKTKANIKKAETKSVDKSIAESVAFAESNMDKLSSSIIYKDVMKDTNVQYMVTSQELKESVVLYALPVEDFSISYEMNLGNLTAKLSDDNSVNIIDSDGNEVYEIKSPYMFDNAKNTSKDITVTLIESENGYVLTYAPDYKWLSSTETIYPVTIDPTITIVGAESSNVNSAAILDTYVSENNDDQYYEEENVTIQQDEDDTCYGYYMFNNLPILPDNCRILNADFNVNLIYDTDNEDENHIGLYQVSGSIGDDFIEDLSWQISEGLTVCDNPIEADNVDSLIDDDNDNQYDFNITTLINNWYQDSQIPRVLSLRSLNEDTYPIDIASSDCGVGSLLPCLTMEYNTISGIPDEMMSHKQDIGLAGTAYVNDYTGELIVERNEAVSNGCIGELKFYTGSGCNVPANSFLGEATSCSLFRTLQNDVISDSDYKIINGDGTVVYSNNLLGISTESFSNSSITISYRIDDSTKSFETYTSNSNTIGATGSSNVFVMTKRTIKNNNNETLDSLDINYSNSHITQITDKICKFNLSYSGGKVSRVRKRSVGNNTDCLSDNKDDSPNDVSTYYDYETSSNHYNKVWYFVRNNASFNATTYFDNMGRITKLEENSCSSDNNRPSYYYTYEYYDNGKIETVTEYSSPNTAGKSLSFAYKNNTTTITDDNNNSITECFNSKGQLISIIDQNGNATFVKHDNGIVKTSNTRNSARNIAEYHYFEGINDLFFTPAATNYDSVTLETNDKVSGNSSAKITATHINNMSANGRHYFGNSIGIEQGSTYTASVWIKKPTGANVTLKLSNGPNNGISDYKAALDVTDWQLVYCTLDASAGDTLNVAIEVDNPQGSYNIYVDDLCIQKSTYYTNPNLIANGDFTPNNAGWGNNATFVEVPNSPNGIVINTKDDYRLRLNGTYSSKNYVAQTVEVPTDYSAKDTKYNFGAWIKTVNSLPIKTVSNRRIGLDVYASRTGSNEHTVTNSDLLLASINYFDDFMDWQYLESEVQLPQDFGDNNTYNALKLVINYDYQLGYLLVDGVSLSQGELYANTRKGKTTEEKREDEVADSFTENGIDRIIVRDLTNANNGLLISESDSIGNTIDYRYDYFGNLASINDATGRIVEYEYDNFQNLSSIIDTYYQNDTEYDTSLEEPNPVLFFDDVEKYIDRAGETMPSDDMDTYVATLKQELDATTITVHYTYLGKRLEKIETLSSNAQNPINTYLFQYDNWNNLVDVFINKSGNSDTPFIHYEYDTNDYRRINSVEYRNGQTIHFVYDDEGNKIYEYDTTSNNQSTNGVSLAYGYYYYDDGTCYGKKDLITGNYESYQDGVVRTTDIDGNVLYSYFYDSDGNKIELINNKKIETEYTSGIDGLTSTKETILKYTSSTNPDTNTITRTYDPMGRIATERIQQSNSNYSILKKYTYYGTGEHRGDDVPESGETEILTTNAIRFVSYYLVDSQNNLTDINQLRSAYWFNRDSLFSTISNQCTYSTATGTYETPQAYFHNTADLLLNSSSISNTDGVDSFYKYDDSGNIISVFNQKKYADHQNNNSLTEYTYDGSSSDSSINGCLTRVTFNNMSENTDSITGETSYTKSENYHLTISYDELGNVTDVFNFNNDSEDTYYNWTRGNMLDSFVFSYYNVDYQYDDSNRRTSKIATINGFNESAIEEHYYWDDDLLVGKKVKCDIDGLELYCDVIVLYDDSNNAYGFVLNKYSDSTYQTINSTNTYYYIKDAKNTIYKVIDSAGNQVVRYNYDNYASPSADYSNANQDVWFANPFIYRDDIYDVETDMYCLNSRYYSPKMGRFISASNALDNGSGTIMCTNLYAYCENNPANNTDYSGIRINHTKKHIPFTTSVLCDETGAYFGRSAVDAYLQQRYV